MALEDHYLLGHHSCANCSDKQRERDGCRKPGYDVKGTEAFRLESPHLHERDKREGVPGKHTIIRECPLGLVLRETPHIFRAIAVANDVENGALSTLDLAPWGQAVVALVGSERGRLREAAQRREKEQGNQRSDSRQSMNVLLGSRNV